MSSLTKKVQGQRQMKSTPIWWGINKATPEQWFDRWEYFISNLFQELKFVQDENYMLLAKPRGKEWKKHLKFHNSKVGSFSVVLKRPRRCDYGGDIEITSLDSGIDVMIRTTTVNQGHLSMCRATVGNNIITFIRDSWKANGSTDKESTG